MFSIFTIYLPRCSYHLLYWDIDCDLINSHLLLFQLAPSSTVVSPEEDDEVDSDEEEEEDSDDMDEEDFEDFDLEHEEEEEGEVRQLQGPSAANARTFNNKGACARVSYCDGC